MTVLNVVYPIFVVCLLLYTYVYEIVACQWKLDLHKDTQVRRHVSDVTQVKQMSCLGYLDVLSHLLVDAVTMYW